VWNFARKYWPRFESIKMSLAFSGAQGEVTNKMRLVAYALSSVTSKSPHPHQTYAMVDMYDDRMEIRGFGNLQVGHLPFTAYNVTLSTDKIHMMQNKFEFGIVVYNLELK
jgi:hypothetical protein